MFDDKSLMWTVLLAISSIVALFKAVGEPMLKLNNTIHEANMRSINTEKNLNDIKDLMKDQSKKYEKIQISINQRIDDIEDDVIELDKRVTMLEK